MHLKYALSLKDITAKPSRRLINHALKDEQATQATFIGQARAREALDFGLGIDAKGYNLYVMGEQATGRFTLVHEYIAKYVRKVLTPDDWCYINNFDDEREPFALRLPPGESKRLVKNMERLLGNLINVMSRPLILLSSSLKRKMWLCTKKMATLVFHR